MVCMLDQVGNKLLFMVEFVIVMVEGVGELIGLLVQFLCNGLIGFWVCVIDIGVIIINVYYD